MANWKFRLNISDIWKKVKNNEIPIYQFVNLFLNRLKTRNFYKELIKAEDLELEDIITDFEFFVIEKNEDKDEFDEIWNRFYDFADTIRLWVNIFD